MSRDSRRSSKNKPGSDNTGTTSSGGDQNIALGAQSAAALALLDEAALAASLGPQCDEKVARAVRELETRFRNEPKRLTRRGFAVICRELFDAEFAQLFESSVAKTLRSLAADEISRAAELVNNVESQDAVGPEIALATPDMDWAQTLTTLRVNQTADALISLLSFYDRIPQVRFKSKRRASDTVGGTTRHANEDGQLLCERCYRPSEQFESTHSTRIRYPPATGDVFKMVFLFRSSRPPRPKLSRRFCSEHAPPGTAYAEAFKKRVQFQRCQLDLHQLLASKGLATPTATEHRRLLAYYTARDGLARRELSQRIQDSSHAFGRIRPLLNACLRPMRALGVVIDLDDPQLLSIRIHAVGIVFLHDIFGRARCITDEVNATTDAAVTAVQASLFHLSKIRGAGGVFECAFHVASGLHISWGTLTYPPGPYVHIEFENALLSREIISHDNSASDQ